MLYIDEYGRDVHQGADYEKNRCIYYLDKSGSKYTSSLNVIDLDDLVCEDALYLDIIKALNLGIKFENIHKDKNGRFYIIVDNEKPKYLEWNDFTILHTRKELYIGFDKNYYIHLYYDERRKGFPLTQEGKTSGFKIPQYFRAIAFPRYTWGSGNKLVIPILCNRVNYFVEYLDFNKLKKYRLYHENVRKVLKLRYKSMIRAKVLRGEGNFYDCSIW